MGWKGTLRSVNAAVRAAERESQRRHKQHIKELEIAEAEDAVGDWKDYIHDLISIHANAADDIDWTAITNKPQPKEPVRSNHRELQAQAKLEAFAPGFFDFLSGGSEKRREALVQAVASASQADEEEYSEACSKHARAFSDWQSDTALAERLLKGDVAAKRDVIGEFQSLTSESWIGSEVVFRINEEWLHGVVTVHTDEVVPNYRRKQLASGRLSETKMPVGEFNELYQDYVCSVALKVAGDLFGLLPDNEVFVTCRTLMLNTKTGHQEQTPILSVQFVRETYRRLNLAGIDPSDSLTNFNHNMAFKRTKGFVEIEPLKPIDT